MHEIVFFNMKAVNYKTIFLNFIVIEFHNLLDYCKIINIYSHILNTDLYFVSHFKTLL